MDYWLTSAFSFVVSTWGGGIYFFIGECGSIDFVLLNMSSYSPDISKIDKPYLNFDISNSGVFYTVVNSNLVLLH